MLRGAYRHSISAQWELIKFWYPNELISKTACNMTENTFSKKLYMLSLPEHSKMLLYLMIIKIFHITSLKKEMRLHQKVISNLLFIAAKLFACSQNASM